MHFQKYSNGKIFITCQIVPRPWSSEIVIDYVCNYFGENCDYKLE